MPSQTQPAHVSETLADFSARCELALIQGEESIEADEKIINMILPRGLGTATHFMFKGLLVCPIGKTEEVYRQMSLSHEQKTFLQPQGVNSVDKNA